MKVCSVDGCGWFGKMAKGYCPKHYQRWKRNGDPAAVTLIYGDDSRRFWSKVRKTESCWLWQGQLDRYGYGVFRLPSGWVKAHRWSYIAVMGQIPDGLVLDHVRGRGCEHRHCVNPDHLEPVTNAENLARSRAS